MTHIPADVGTTTVGPDVTACEDTRNSKLVVNSKRYNAPAMNVCPMTVCVVVGLYTPHMFCVVGCTNTSVSH
ncbi:hypothetical protein PBCVNEJV4_029R [Paramecium bursaria Chlorella virus NE-JV-4]|nr:hypothetical protein PBCVNEJV4_029R [Paramecium bursaria Chlorella virus NE-JV-4]